MNTLTLNTIMIEQLILLVDTLLVGEVGLCLESRELSGDVWKHEELVVVNLGSQPCRTLVGKVARVELLVNDEVQRLHSLRHLTVVVCHIVLFRFEHSSLYTFL